MKKLFYILLAILSFHQTEILTSSDLYDQDNTVIGSITEKENVTTATVNSKNYTVGSGELIGYTKETGKYLTTGELNAVLNTTDGFTGKGAFNSKDRFNIDYDTSNLASNTYQLSDGSFIANVVGTNRIIMGYASDGSESGRRMKYDLLKPVLGTEQ